jgi:probable rRNA maturation factor
VILNRQADVRVDLGDARRFVHRLRAVLRLGRREFNVSFVGSREMAGLNKAYRGIARSTDVLSFPWQESRHGSMPPKTGEFSQFLGEVVISVPTAQRNARAEGHSARAEIRWLILHGVLHLLGYDHETDSGEMTAMELALRDRLNGKRRIENGRAPRQTKARAGSLFRAKQEARSHHA